MHSIVIAIILLTWWSIGITLFIREWWRDPDQPGISLRKIVALLLMILWTFILLSECTYMY